MTSWTSRAANRAAFRKLLKSSTRARRTSGAHRNMQDETEPVRLPLDTCAVQNWLSAHGQAFKDVRVLAQFGAGQSNPTYLLQCTGAAGEQKKLVLRRKPPGELLPSAHDVAREHRVLAALQGSRVPVPRVWGLCTRCSCPSASPLDLAPTRTLTRALTRTLTLGPRLPPASTCWACPST